MSLDLQTLLTGILVVQIGLLEFFILRNVISLRVRFQGILNDFANPEARQGFWKEIAHGVMRALGERQGALKGAATREVGSALIESGDLGNVALAGLASFLPKKYQAFAPILAPYIQQFLGSRLPAAQQQQQQGQGLP